MYFSPWQNYMLISLYLVQSKYTQIHLGILGVNSAMLPWNSSPNIYAEFHILNTKNWKFSRNSHFLLMNDQILFSCEVNIISSYEGCQNNRKTIFSLCMEQMQWMNYKHAVNGCIDKNLLRTFLDTLNVHMFYMHNQISPVSHLNKISFHSLHQIPKVLIFLIIFFTFCTFFLLHHSFFNHFT